MRKELLNKSGLNRLQPDVYVFSENAASVIRFDFIFSPAENFDVHVLLGDNLTFTLSVSCFVLRIAITISATPVF